MKAKIWGRFNADNLPKIVEESIPIIRQMGLKVLEMSSEQAILQMPLDGNANHIGMMYAGVLSTFGEVPGGALFLTNFNGSKYVPIVTNLATSFKAPAMTDVTITARMEADEVARILCELESEGKSGYSLENEIKDTNGTVVAVTQGEYLIRSFG